MLEERERSGSSSSATSVASLRMEGQLRDKIKELQEKRATGLMAEISELRKEKSLAISQVKRMDMILSDIRKENALIRQRERNFVDRIQTLERLLLEEKLVSESFRRKYQSIDKKNNELMRKLEVFVVHQKELSAKDKCHSLSDLSQIDGLVKCYTMWLVLSLPVY